MTRQRTGSWLAFLTPSVVSWPRPRGLFAAALLLAVWAAPAHGASSGDRTAWIIATTAHVRAGPSLSSPTLGLIRIGTRLSISTEDGEWVQAKFTYLAASLEGWLRRDVIGPDEPTSAWIGERLEAVQADDPAERLRWAERLAMVEPGGDSFQALADVLRNLGREREAASVLENGPAIALSAAAPADGARLQQRSGRELLALPPVMLRQAPSPSAVPVPGFGTHPALGDGEPGEVVETAAGVDGQTWARVATFRSPGGRLRITGWAPEAEIRKAVRFTRVRAWAGPQVLYAYAGDWAETYFLDEFGNARCQSASFDPDPVPGQLWRLGQRLLVVFPDGVEPFEPKGKTVCMGFFCARTLGRFPPRPEAGRVRGGDGAREVAQAAVNELFTLGSLAGVEEQPTVRDNPWQPAPGTYVFQLEFRTAPSRYLHVLVHQSGVAAAFLTTNSGPD